MSLSRYTSTLIRQTLIHTIAAEPYMIAQIFHKQEKKKKKKKGVSMHIRGIFCSEVSFFSLVEEFSEALSAMCVWW